MPVTSSAYPCKKVFLLFQLLTKYRKCVIMVKQKAELYIDISATTMVYPGGALNTPGYDDKEFTHYHEKKYSEKRLSCLPAR